MKTKNYGGKATHPFELGPAYSPRFADSNGFGGTFYSPHDAPRLALWGGAPSRKFGTWRQSGC